MKKLLRILIPFVTVLLAVALGGSVMAAPAQEIQIQPVYAEHINPVHQQEINILHTAAPEVFYADAAEYYTSIKDAALELREEFEDREELIVIGLLTDQNPNEVPLHEMILEEALLHTGSPTQGDYLRWQYKEYACGIGGTYNPKTGLYSLVLKYNVTYYTSKAQEKALDIQVEKLLDQLNVYKADDYHKVCAIYDYMCQTIRYDTEGLAAQNSDLIYTAYAALINQKSVCQGYANLFYRLALELGVDCRMITGWGNGGRHAWNIVKLNGKYYNLDATWDATRKQAKLDYEFFLKCNTDFGDHQRDEQFRDSAFNDHYPMGGVDYTYTTPTFTPGEFDGKEGVTDSDAVYLLRHSLFPGDFPVGDGTDKDINCDGIFSDADAIYLLRFTLFPEEFPLYPVK